MFMAAFIRKSQKLEMTQLVFKQVNGWKNYGMSVLWEHYKLGDSSEKFAEWEKPNSKGYTLND